jgi:hypothetical protein
VLFLANPTVQNALYPDDLKKRILRTRHTLEFAIPLPASTVTNQQLQDKAQVRETIFTQKTQKSRSRLSIAAPA